MLLLLLGELEAITVTVVVGEAGGFYSYCYCWGSGRLLLLLFAELDAVTATVGGAK